MLLSQKGEYLKKEFVMSFSSRLARFLIFVAAVCSFSQDNTLFTYRNATRLYTLMPDAANHGFFGLANPAALTYAQRGDMALAAALAPNDDWSLRQGDFLLAGGMSGLGLRYLRPDDDRSLTRLFLAKAGGNRDAGFGLGAAFTLTDEDELKQDPVITTGLLFRPFPRVSLGASGFFSTDNSFQEGAVELGIRPLGNQVLTLGGDYVYRRLDNDDNEQLWSAYAAVEAVEGIRVSARYFDDERIALGVHVGFGNTGTAIQQSLTTEGEEPLTTVALRGGARNRSMIENRLYRRSKTLAIDLSKPVTYNAPMLFEKSQPFLPLIRALEQAAVDSTVASVAVKASSMPLDAEKLWEIRYQLLSIRAAGKSVYVYLDRGSMFDYYFASVADTLFLDPKGFVLIPGLVSGGSFYKNLLDSIGVGFNEWRFFDYKSALENFSRTDMSRGAREQREEMLRDYYDLIREGISSSRNMEPSAFDSLVNNGVLFTPEEALEVGLVDTLGRWEEVKKMAQRSRKSKSTLHGIEWANNRIVPAENSWGEPPHIAVVYANGSTSMESGMNVKKIAKIISKIAKDDSFDALVLRVDSPGGDALAADLLAEAVKECAEKKPVIVSQGSVAASGGYWVSMYGDSIVAAPVTITGSIGVIGGWVYDKGLKDSLGITTDHVQVGEHADFQFGWSLPFIGLGLPNRDLTEYEQQRMRKWIMSLYRDFVGKVADARNRSEEYIDSISQGRVWTGTGAQEVGLVDTLGGLMTALNMAARQTGVQSAEDVVIQEFPKTQFFSLRALIRQMMPTSPIKKSLEEKYLKIHSEHNGIPLLLLPMQFHPEMITYGLSEPKFETR